MENMSCPISGCKFKDIGLLLLRVGLGVLFIIMGWIKIHGGTEVFAQVGSAMANFGITWNPVLWGGIASYSEFIGGILLVLGLLTPVASFFIFCVMVVATVMMGNVSSWDFMKIWPQVYLALTFFCLILIGPGRISLDKMMCRHSSTDSEGQCCGAKDRMMKGKM